MLLMELAPLNLNFELEPTVRAELVEASRGACTRMSAFKLVDADSAAARWGLQLPPLALA